MSGQRHLVIMARAPRLGAGKRRLARDVGALAAWRFQRRMLERLRRRLARDPRWTTWLAVTPDRSGPWATGARVIPQGAGGLGARMARLLREPSPGPVVIVGSDIPDLDAEAVTSAARYRQGGWWLRPLRNLALLGLYFLGVPTRLLRRLYG